jgi:hypothetical protein
MPSRFRRTIRGRFDINEIRYGLSVRGSAVAKQRGVLSVTASNKENA